MTWTFEATNIAGILNGESRVEPGLNVIRASNWQGKSSFIKAVQTALGVAAPLTDGADTGAVRYDSDTDSGTIELERTDGEVTQSGTPILTDQYDIVRAELFACLGENNEIRRAVRAGQPLEEQMLRPLDFENIDEQIAELTRERDQIDSEIERAEQASQQLPALERRVKELEAELTDLREKHDRLVAEANPEDNSEDETRQQLSEVESDRNRVQNRIEQLERTIERTEQNIQSKEAELDSLEVPDDTKLQQQLSEAQNRLQDLKRDKRVLESVHSATEMVLTEDRLDLITEVDRELTGESFSCWTCGAETTSDAVQARLTKLRERISSVQAKADAQQTTVEELEAKRESISQNRRRRETLEAELAQLREKVSEDRQSLADARERLESLEAKIETLSEQVTTRIDEITDTESEIKYREAELSDVTADREELQQRADQLEMLRAEREEIATELETLRERKTTIRQDTRTAFESAMNDMLDRFETGFDTARLTGNFELVVARDGQETSLDALSEGEVELLGFVAAMAGYEAFDVAEVSPLLLVDQVGALAEHNLHTLVEYLRNRTQYLIFTAYPAFDAPDATLIEPRSWAVASSE
jgi:chromosome segregation ATPase